MSYLKNINRAALNRKITLTKKVQNEIFNTFDVALTDMTKQLTSSRGLKKAFIQNRMKAVYVELEDLVEEYSMESARAAVDVHKNTLEKIINMGGQNISLDNTFANIPMDAVNAMKSGEIYKDGKDLSKRIWNITQQSGKQIENIIYNGIVQGTSATELAKLLQEHVNPASTKIWDRKKIRELLGDGYAWANKQIEYNALRLARTSIAHTFTLANKLSAQKNPFVQEMKWHSVFAHGRTCSVCMERDGKVYLVKELPFDHPNGLCWEEPVYNKSLDQYAEDIRNWVNGEPNSILDEWYDNKYKPTNEEDIKKLTPECIKEQLSNLPEGSKRYIEKYNELVGQLVQQELGLGVEETKLIKWGKATQEGLSYRIGNNEHFIENNFASKARWVRQVKNLKQLSNYEDVINALPLISNRAMSYDRSSATRKGLLTIIKDLQEVRSELETTPIKLTWKDLPNAVIGKTMRDRITPHVKHNGFNPSNPIFSHSYDIAVDFLTSKIDTTAIRNIKKSGFNLEMMKPNSRAFAKGNKSIHISETTKPSSIIHETSHIMHNSDEDMQKLVKSWFDMRTKGEELNVIYKGSSEYGYKDNFINQYVGKVYDFKGGDRGVEVVSMGMQYMFEDPAAFYKKDPEHFNLIYGIMRGVYK